MSDTSQGEGWRLAGDGKWYPPEPPQPVAPSTDASLTRQTSNFSQGASQDDAPSERASIWGTSSTADPGAIAPPSPPPSSSGDMVVAGPVPGGTPLFRKPIFWGARQQSSFLSPSSQASRRVAATPPRTWLQRRPRFQSGRQARQGVAARRKAAARRKVAARLKVAARRRAAARRAIPGKRRRTSRPICRLATQRHFRTAVLRSMTSL